MKEKREDFVTKVQEMAIESGVFTSKKKLNVIVGAVMKALTETVVDENKTLRFNNVGIFKPKRFEKRTIKHPQTGEVINLKAFTTAAFHCTYKKEED